MMTGIEFGNIIAIGLCRRHLYAKITLEYIQIYSIVNTVQTIKIFLTIYWNIMLFGVIVRPGGLVKNWKAQKVDEIKIFINVTNPGKGET